MIVPGCDWSSIHNYVRIDSDYFRNNFHPDIRVVTRWCIDNSFNEFFIPPYPHFWYLIGAVFNQIDLYFDELFSPVEIIKLLATLVWKLRIHYASIVIFLCIFVYRQCFVCLSHIVIFKIMAWISISTMVNTILSLNKTFNISKI